MELELEKYSYERREPTTINQCINDLANGYADASVYMELEKNFMELLEDEWFHQIPLVRYKYASMLLHGYFDGIYEDNYIEGDPDLAMEILQPMAEAGLVTAQYDLGWGFHYCNSDSECEAKVKWMLKASKQDYYRAHSYLASTFTKVDYGKFSIETQKDFLSEIARIRPDEWCGEYAKEKLKAFTEENVNTTNEERM